MNVSQYDIDEDLVDFISYLPENTIEDYSWMEKYIVDLNRHYKKQEYELAILSAHIIYMFIISCFVLKKREFDVKKIKSDFQDNPKYKNITISGVSPYIYSCKPDKKLFSLLQCSNSENKKHQEIVQYRDNVAHCSGIYQEKEDFAKYIKLCIESLSVAYHKIFLEFINLPFIESSLNQENGYSTTQRDYLLSPKETSYLFIHKNLDNIINYLKETYIWEEYIKFKEILGFCHCETYSIDICNPKIYVENVKYGYDVINGHMTFDIKINMIFNVKDNIEIFETSKSDLMANFEYNDITKELDIDIASNDIIELNPLNI